MILRARSADLARSLAAAVMMVMSRLGARDRGIVLLYHRVTEGEPVECGLVPTVRAADFERQLRFLRRCYRVVPLDEMLEAVRKRRRGRRIPVAITFDDDLPEHVHIAAPRLRAAELPATFFLCGASLGGPTMFWWERLERAVAAGVDVGALVTAEVPAVTVAGTGELAEQIKRASPERRERMAAILRQVSPEDPDEVLGRREVAELGRHFTIGFHTRAHEYLPTLDDEALARALREGRDELEAAAGQPLRAIAYPHGGVDVRVPTEALAAGFDLGLTTEAGSVGQSAMLVGRVEPAPAPPGLHWLRIERALRR
jgi:peptidoglycan/xylan/chitin deacetylase (PgdA/CDA1 family)